MRSLACKLPARCRYRRSPGNSASRVTRSIGECRMSLWSTVEVSVYSCGPAHREASRLRFRRGLMSSLDHDYLVYVEDFPALWPAHVVGAATPGRRRAAAT